MDKTFSISKGDKPTYLRLKNFRNKGDGTTDVDIEYDETFRDSVKAALNKNEISSQEMGEYIGKLIEKATNGIDGYKMEIEDERPKSSKDTGDSNIDSDDEAGA